MSNATLMERAQNGRVTEQDDSSRPRKRSFAPEYKLAILSEFEALTEPGAWGALLRREGLYSSHIVEWRRARDAGAFDGLAAKGRPRRSVAEIEVERLRKQNARLERELRQTKAALDIVGRAHALLEALCESAASDDPKSTR